ncbi:L-type lectin family protein [Levilactobacillus huananensis]|uniref:lectin-like domain-containing protein n=1 Tax=Levilactobacillus huananensis TaxID=2486019 RepID=UPI000F76F1D5|nr:hypothetical protein [Levilactobacillus huananensis]
MKRIKVWLGLIVAIGLGLSQQVGYADSDYDNALKTAPQGISLENIFTPGTTSNNTAAVVATTNPAITGTQAAKVNNGKNQFGALWSTADNVFNLKKNETASMWIYFGNNGKKAADGMALVFHNDDRGLNATPTFGKTIYGETLGVWGIATDRKQATADKVAASAIQNSWALEFDTHPNKSTSYSNAGDADSFDVGFNGPHLANGYPGDVATYDMVKTTQLIPIPASGYYAQQQHEGVLNGDYTFLSNGSWHHLTVDWRADTKVLTYTFNDKDPVDGTDQPGVSEKATLDLDKIDPKNTGQAQWGFTGATGSSYENNLVVMERIPGLVDAKATTTLMDKETNQVIGDGGILKGGHKFQLDYQLDYLDGKQSWKDLIAKMNLPTNLNYDAAKITYADGTTNELSLNDLMDNQVEWSLPTELDSANSRATISLTGTAEDVKAAVNVAASASTFTAVNGVVTTDTAAFTLQPTLELNLFSLSGSSTQIEAGASAVFKGLVIIPEGIDLSNADMTVSGTLNGTALPDFKMPAGDDGRFDLTLTPDQLKAGSNVLKLWVTDPYKNVSNVVTYTIIVPGQLAFQSVAEASSFETTSLTGSSQQIKRTSDWQVKILDTREAGASWALQVTATPFVSSDGRTLSGELRYYDEDGQTAIGGDPITVSDGVSTDKDDVTDVVGNWQDESGLLLDVDGGAVRGNYEATITWTLNNAP